MTEQIIHKTFERQPQLLADATEIQELRKRKKNALKMSLSKKTPVTEQKSWRGTKIRSRNQWKEEHERLGTEEWEVLSKIRKGWADDLESLRIYVIREARRLEEIVGDGCDSVSEAWKQIYLVRAAASIAWDVPSTEIEAAIEVFRETDVFKCLSREHNRERTKRRKEAGFWKSGDIRAANAKQKRKKRASMTKDQREAERQARRERDLRRKDKRAAYGLMLEELPTAAE